MKEYLVIVDYGHDGGYIHERTDDLELANRRFEQWKEISDDNVVLVQVLRSRDGSKKDYAA